MTSIVLIPGTGAWCGNTGGRARRQGMRAGQPGLPSKPKSTLSRSWSMEISTTSRPVVPLTVTVPRFSLAVGPLAASAAVATTPRPRAVVIIRLMAPVIAGGS
jgi:hypothetical protein